MPKKVVKKAVKKAAKPAAKKKPVPAKAMAAKEGKLIGEITHYFSNIGVGVIKLAGAIKEGEMIRITGGENTDFTQEAKSMQIEHEEVKSAKKGDSVGLKVKEKVREGYKVYKI
jgi:translation elongation factor EF-1alpha